MNGNALVANTSCNGVSVRSNRIITARALSGNPSVRAASIDVPIGRLRERRLTINVLDARPASNGGCVVTLALLIAHGIHDAQVLRTGARLTVIPNRLRGNRNAQRTNHGLRSFAAHGLNRYGRTIRCIEINISRTSIGNGVDDVVAFNESVVLLASNLILARQSLGSR